jgi:hypothetical protein
MNLLEDSILGLLYGTPLTLLFMILYWAMGCP